MKTISTAFVKESLDFKTFDSYFRDKRFAVFDIETTGLSPHFDSLILSGFVLSDKDELKLIQFFAEDPLDEKEVIDKSLELISNLDFIVTYNGRFFDVPFMKKRAQKYGFTFPEIYDLDLFILFKHYSDFPKLLKSLSQKSMESYGGFSSLRSDTISGGESVDLYRRYQDTRGGELEAQILLHNSDDVKQLYRLISLLRNTDIHRALWKNGFPLPGGLVKSVSYKHQDLIVDGIMKDAVDYIKFNTMEEPFSFQSSKTSGEFQLVIPCDKESSAFYFDASSLLEGHLLSLEDYPGFASGFLVVKEGDRINYAEVNFFLTDFLPQVFSLIKDSE